PPRRIGSLKIGNLSLHFGSTAAVLTMVPSGLRTAMAYAFGVRIMTPSMTAWPPTIRSRSLVLIINKYRTDGTYDTNTTMPAMFSGRVFGCNSSDQRHHAGI